MRCINFTKAIFRLIGSRLPERSTNLYSVRCQERIHDQYSAFFAFEAVARGLNDVSNNRQKCADASGIGQVQLRLQKRLELTLFWYNPSCCIMLIPVILMLTSIFSTEFHKKRGEVSVKTRSTSASRSLTG